MKDDKYNLVKFGKKNRGYRHERVKFNDREKAFAKHWEEENNKSNYNYGVGILQALFVDEPGHPFNIMRPAYLVKKIAPIERCIVATIIQWLGSGVGFCFLEESLKECGYKIEQIKR